LPEFIHLHNHSHYSLLDAICTVEGLVETARNFNMPALALTDHGVMYGAMEFYKKAKDKGVKPIIGCEMYILTKGSRFDKTAPPNLPKGEEKKSPSRPPQRGGGYHHLVLLAKDADGYRNLMKLVSIGHTEGFYYKPRIDVEVLKKYSKGLVALSACPGGVVSAHLVKGNSEEAREAAVIYKEIFGEDFYLEIQNHGMEIERPILQNMPKLGKELGLKLVGTNDIHYLKPEHSIAHNIFLYINTDLSKDREGKNLERDLRYGTDQIYFKSSEEMCDVFRDFPEAIKSTLEIAEKCNLELPMGEYYMPKFPVPEDFDHDKDDDNPSRPADTAPPAGAGSPLRSDKRQLSELDAYLTKLAHEGLRKRIPNVTDREINRLNEELNVIREMKFSGYFLIVWDFVNYAKKNGCLVGPGRGSSAGSLVCYALNITSVNPLDYGLFFERFLNPERVSMPDIDIDFQDDLRDDVIRYSKEKYGEHAVSQIVTFNRLKTKAVLKDVGRVLNYPFETINEVTKHVPSIFGRIKSLEDCYKEIPEFKQYFDAEPERKKLLNYAIILENLNKNVSIHASGVVIAPSNITDHSPVARTPQTDNQYMTQYDMKMLEDAGLIKMDFLGLKELKILKQTIELIEKRNRNDQGILRSAQNDNVKIDLDTLPLDDSKTYELFAAGQTIGIFQFSKPKMREYLTKLKPKDINDLAAMNALYRPGPMELIPEFIEKKFGRKQITYLHPRIEPILKETYGIIVYQEQVMQIVREIAGYSLAKADIVRRAMGKKDNKLMKQQEKEFISGAEKNGIDKKLAKEIFQLIKKFADYGFNKSHSVAYSILAYYTAYMKSHYPLEFMCTLLNCRKDDTDEMVLLINECRRMKIKLSLPNINDCYSDFTIDDKEVNRIKFGLASIKNIGTAAVENIVKEREKNGEFESFTDFCSRIDTRLVNKKSVESLIYAGAFDVIEPNRRKLYENFEMIMDRVGNRSSVKEAAGQLTLLAGGRSEQSSIPDILNTVSYGKPDWSQRKKLSFEKSVLGLYLSSHPLANYEKEIARTATLRFGDAEDFASGRIDSSRFSTVSMSGIISNLKVKQSKKGKTFCVFTLEDFTGQGECIVFPQLFERYRETLQNDEIVTVVGRPEENGNTLKIIADRIMPLAPGTRGQPPAENGKSKNGLIVKIQAGKFDAELLYELKDVLKQEGETRRDIWFEVRSGATLLKKIRIESVKYDEGAAEKLKEVFGEENLIEM
jgi:DNA polymerase-3 subunit alpha